ncbi:SRPBCC family protein [Methylobacterium pseudosasicola]|uniref:Polyketide cyclase / dehydrase and lipid transport n=1 Tax=Methylobacterium pseudosasicola TaxID=582667 RepID=A0A1I4SI33_9HYPH|nr:SRPBCC family protein [Methylobacterium pseudosasicola]SFM64107.1 Polyketide cyclase / dehydrase and lipid transport [Methylobacterium pseudosasicola]
MTSKILFAALTFAGLSATPALALDVTRTATVAAPPATVWKTIGEFCGIGDWHPAVEKCVLSEKGGKKVRTLSLKGGGTIVEEQVARDDRKMDYTYAILESPLPVEGYKSTLSVAPDGKGSKLTWTGSFKAKGAPDAKAEEVVAGIYEGGLKGIAEKAK